MIQMLVIADDFTGALDTGVQFAKRGYRTLITFHQTPDMLNARHDAQVMVVDTESRHLPAKEAYSRVSTWTRAACAAGIQILYKKVDSTMRGNVGAELAGALDASGRRAAIFVPAYPRLGRTVVGGKVYVDNVPLCKTTFAVDPFTPVDGETISDTIRVTAPRLCVQNVSPGALLRSLDALPKGAVLVVDTENEQQMQEAALSLYALRGAYVLAGCAGFAQMLPCMLNKPALISPASPVIESALIVCGSVNPIALNQIHTIEEAGVPSFCLSPEQCVDAAYWQTAKGDAYIASILQTMAQNRCVILKSADAPEDVEKVRAFANGGGVPAETLHQRIADSLGRLSARLSGHTATSSLMVVIGGDTLFGFMNHINATELVPEKEIRPGIVQSQLLAGGRRQHIVSKAGGFGSDATLREICAYYHVFPASRAVSSSI